MLTLICWLLNLKLSEINIFFFYLLLFIWSCFQVTLNFCSRVVSSQQFRGSFQYRPFDWSAGSLGSLADAERKGSCLCQSVQVKKKKLVILLVCHGICLTQNDSKEFRQQAVLPFQRSQSRESGGKGEKDVTAARGTVGVRCTYKRVSTFYALQSQTATRHADIFFFFVPFFFFFFFTRVTDFAKKKGTAPKLGRILWFINCFFSLQSTRAASLPTTDGLSFSSKRQAGSSRHFK